MISPLVGVSLKTYFGYAETCDWLDKVAHLLADNWLRNGVELVVFPSSPLLERARMALAGSGAQVGAQDVSWTELGAATGEVRASLLAEMGCRYTEVGHAERREYFSEDDDVVAAKAATAARHGLIPLICVGEQERDSADAAAEVVRQARHVVDRLSGQAFVIAYEPVWAIGAAEPARPETALRIGAALRASIPQLNGPGRLIYGGTAGPGTLTQLAAEFDGVFLGRRAHRIEGLRQVLEEAARLVGTAAALGGGAM